MNKTVYKFQTLKDVADFLSIPPKLLSYALYIKKIDSYYTVFEIPKKSGGSRRICASHGKLKEIQRRLADQLMPICSSGKNKVSHGFVKNKSICTNARIHVHRRYVLQVDLKDFFDSIHFGRVLGFFKKNKNFLCSDTAARILAQLSCYQGKVPQGSPSSPVITNMICQVMDRRVVQLARAYRLNYTRYADDLTFSTNRKEFKDQRTTFLKKLQKIISKSGFEINSKKTRFTDSTDRQVVTGLTVNKKINSSRDFIKQTRAMADSLYKKSIFYIDGNPGTIEQLEGRFNFIFQMDHFAKSENGAILSSRDREYQKFLFYKYFLARDTPLIITEGKTDVLYLKAALKSLYREFPQLVTKKSNGEFELKIRFLKRSNRLSHFFKISRDGADSMTNIYRFFSGRKKNHDQFFSNYCIYFKEILKQKSFSPVFLLFDNEQSKEKPLMKMLKVVKRTYEEFSGGYSLQIHSDFPLFILINPKNKSYIPVNGENDGIAVDKICDYEIESLFPHEVRSLCIKGKSFCMKDNFDTKEYFGKGQFAQYVYGHYQKIDFSNFRPIFQSICSCCRKL